MDSYQSSPPILTKITSEGDAFIVRESDFSNVPSESRDITGAFDGTQFLISNLPVNNPVTIHIILNIEGNKFKSVNGIDLFFNLSFEVYINGVKDDFLTFSSTSPMEIIITPASLSYLLGTCKLSRGDNLLCVYDSGGNFTKDGITTNNATSGMIIKLTKLSHIVGGLGGDFGFPSNADYDTWLKIKLLFR
ncbi:hypothetical protein ACFL1R_01000 [Candidatus Latescibacterota bacterium]